jgi:hypothetical protein
MYSKELVALTLVSLPASGEGEHEERVGFDFYVTVLTFNL